MPAKNVAFTILLYKAVWQITGGITGTQKSSPVNYAAYEDRGKKSCDYRASGPESP